MKFPEWRPMPRHLNNDDDTQDAVATVRLVGPLVLIFVSLALLLLAWLG